MNLVKTPIIRNPRFGIWDSEPKWNFYMIESTGVPMSSEERSINKVYLEQLLLSLSQKERETVTLWSQGYKPHEIAKLISDKYEKRLIKPHTIVLRISKILKKLRQISANNS